MSAIDRGPRVLAEFAAAMPIADFVCVDTETANNSRSSLCSIGFAVVVGGNVVSEITQWVNPECEFSAWNAMVNGLDESIVANAPTLPAY